MNAGDTRRIVKRAAGIAGWLAPGAAALFALLDEVQQREGIEGNLFEIGAHHGKSAVLLGSLARPGESVGICDIFGDQGANTSASGAGDRAIFESNMRQHAPLTKVEIFEKLSGDLTADEISGPVRIFHVDGGHLAEEALGDLRLAEKTLHPRGAIVVDDPWRPEWPGVTEAILEFLEGPWVPVAIGFNKLAIVPADAIDAYRSLTSEATWSEYIDTRVYSSKTLPLGGRDTLIFYVPSYQQLPRLERGVALARWAVNGVARRVAPSLAP